MKKLFSLYTLLRLLPAILGGAMLMGSCNSDPVDQPDYEPAQSVAVQSFSLSPNAKVLANLDSVFFSIDLEHGVIFNADSLPMGTPVDRLVPKLSLPSTVSKAVFSMTGGLRRTGDVDYKVSPTDTLDFSGRVTLTLSTDDDALQRVYTVKVNVHKMVADSLMWDRTAVAPLPSGAPDPLSQRTVLFAGKVWTLIGEADGSSTLTASEDLNAGVWSSLPALPFSPDVRSFTASDSRLYILDDRKNLYSSADGYAWVDEQIRWETIIGPFGESVLGILKDGSELKHDVWPHPAGFVPSVLESDFPTEDLSNFISFKSKWAGDPIGYLTGGVRDGRTLSATWAYDGEDWAKISNAPLPEISGVLLIPYFNYRKTATSWIQTEFSVCLAIGGRLPDGTLNRKVYLSYDNGVNWMEAPSLLQLPDFMPTLTNADVVILTTPLEADLGANWRTRTSSSEISSSETSSISSSGKRISYFVDGSDVEWDCPYIYLFGGHKSDGRLNPEIWRAVLARLTFAPLF